ncbi:5120_t:CDS:2 [Cetraspora pellucida]|uniref:5120_t:CDS:1 n=1 Tax=Cetraspora pellucida TaxID=1433469 RepID=A0ACA9MN68_9GLOM|nr:5120_t:CDS:2 [Cetraspora pellucida]
MTTKFEENKRKKKEAELGTFKDENDKEICNWLLHYLFTFHQYNSKQNLNAFTSAEQIQRYDFGVAARMEENTAAIASLISKAIINLGQGITGKLSEIRGEMVANFQEIANLRQEIDNFRNNLQVLDKDIENFRHEFARLQDNVKNSLQLTSQQITSQFSSQISNLQSQISQLASRPVTSDSSSSSGGVDVSDYNELVIKSNRKSEIVANFTRELSSCLSRNGSSQEITKLVQDFIDR